MKIVLIKYYPKNATDGIVYCLTGNSMTLDITVAKISALLTPVMAPTLM